MPSPALAGRLVIIEMGMTSTALHDTLTASSAHLQEYSGAATASDFGDVGAEFNALLGGCGTYDLGWRAKVVLTGEDRVRWLNGMITNNVRDLAPRHGVYGFVLNPQGRIQGDLYTYNRGSSLLLDTDRSQLESLLKIFDHYIIMDDVEVADATDKLTAIGLAGPHALEVLRSTGIEAPDLQPLQFMDLEWQNVSLTVARADNPKTESYQVWLAPANVNGLWQRLIEKGARPVGTTALELLRIASGIPRYGVDFRDRDLPQETEQQRALNFNKGCYIGQEIVERIRSRGSVHRKFTGFDVRGLLPVPGTKIESDGKEAGEVTSSAILPLSSGDRAVALGYIRRESIGKTLQAGESILTAVDVPFSGVFPH
jgi:folate-binding protein YgfZ